MALDEVLKDSEWVLAQPEVRLESLEMEVKQVRAEMGSLMSFICASVINHDITKVMGQ
jgi:hypothetical protein